MSTDAIDFTFSVRQTLRTGLDVARRKALAIIALALASRFVASEIVSRIIAFASTFGVSLAPLEGMLVFFGSLVLMWFAVVPLTIQAIEARGLGEPSGAVSSSGYGMMRACTTAPFRFAPSFGASDSCSSPTVWLP